VLQDVLLETLTCLYYIVTSVAAKPNPDASICQIKKYLSNLYSDGASSTDQREKRPGEKLVRLPSLGIGSGQKPGPSRGGIQATTSAARSASLYQATNVLAGEASLSTGAKSLNSRSIWPNISSIDGPCGSNRL
jgi:hypothetical protein